jgi:hypothetical protein
MNKIILTKCKICGEEKTSRGFGQHIVKTHGMPLTDYIIQYEFDGTTPTCKCGCGEPVVIRGYCVMEYVNGHCASGHFKIGVNPRKNVEQWKKNVTDGIRRYNAEARKNNVNFRKGENNNFYGRRHTDETKNLIRSKVEEQISQGRHAFIGNNNGRIKGSSLEEKFKDYLISLKIQFVQSLKVPYLVENKTPRNKYYDFYLPCINTVVELHGSYWHPRNLENLSDIQLSNIRNDVFKRSLAKSRLFNILTIYDDELTPFIEQNILVNLINESVGKKLDLTHSGILYRNNVIELPDYWIGLVDEDSITVNLTSIGKMQDLWVENIVDNTVVVGGENINCFYTIFAERKDVGKLIVEY